MSLLLHLIVEELTETGSLIMSPTTYVKIMYQGLLSTSISDCNDEAFVRKI